LERFARLVGDGLRFKEQVRAKGLHFDAVAPERGSNFFVARAEGGLVEAVPADRGRAGRADQLPQNFQAVAPPHEQRQAARAERGVERKQRMMQPPARGRARRPRRFLVRRPDEHGHNQTARNSGGQRGIIREPQVAPEPDDGGRWRHFFFIHRLHRFRRLKSVDDLSGF
jgi:hypothetical protein